MILFRTEGNSTVGMGHVTRCVALAQALVAEGAAEIYFAPTDAEAQFAIVRSGFQIFNYFPHPRLTVTDFHGAMHRMVRAARHPGEVELVDEASEGRSSTVTVAMLPAPAQEGLFAGPEYAILRPQFWNPPRRRSRTSKRVLLSFGGADPAHLTERAWDALRSLPLDIVATWGPAFQRTPPEGLPIVEGGDKMASNFSDADLVVCSAGMTVFEAAAMGCPAVVIPQHEREAARIPALGDAGLLACALEGGEGRAPHDLNAGALRTVVGSVLEQTLGVWSQDIVDGRGARRVARIILDRFRNA